MSVDSSKPPVLFLMGPTASGKTVTAMSLAAHLPVELVSVDSTLVYRGLDIGSAKPTPEELASLPHRLVNIRDPADPYSAADFRRDALQAIAEIHAAGRIPLLVGGTMLYFKVLCSGLADLPSADPALRSQLQARADAVGWPAMHRELAGIDPETASRLHPNHSQRILRALEVYHSSGTSMSELRRRQAQDLPATFTSDYKLFQLALLPRQRALLHERIGRRFELMLQQGFEEEVRLLYERKDLKPESPAIRAVGYRQMWDYLDGRLSREEMVYRSIAATRQLVKRQITWLRSWGGLHELYIDAPGGEPAQIADICADALNYLEGITI